MAVDLPVLALILAMAGATYLTRIAGFWLVRLAKPGPRLQAALDAVPGAVLASIVAPVALATGPAESMAALATLGLAMRLPTALAVPGGIGALVLLRALGL